jgi:hypothetical protein
MNSLFSSSENGIIIHDSWFPFMLGENKVGETDDMTARLAALRK